MSGARRAARTMTVPADDRGLAYGDGLFETMAWHDGRVPALEAHLDRLERGCAVLGFPMPPRETLRDAVQQAGEGEGPAIVKLVLTRGSGGRGYEPPAQAQPRLLVSGHAWPADIDAQRSRGVDVVRLRARLGDAPALAGIKHLNRLDQVLAARELASCAPAREGVVLDQSGAPVCGVMSNLFLVQGDGLVTPDLGRCGVAGIIRQMLLAYSGKNGLPIVTVRPVTVAELDAADEVFLTNSIRGVLPARSLDGRDLGPPGPVARTAAGVLAAAGLVL